PEHFAVTGMRAEYKKQALLHDILVPCVQVSKEEDGAETCVVSLQDTQGGIYTNVEFEGRRNYVKIG
ncbi:MAG: hypothetical protein K2G16_10985, partial [Lachnospiraceae bacterium]|nr:hypothetical protein [Lachnospiraceae bacterium]